MAQAPPPSPSLKKDFKRPYATHYYRLVEDEEPAFTSQGSCSSDHGAIRATVVRIFLGQYAKALVHDRRDGVLLYTIKNGPGGLKVHWGKATDEYGRAVDPKKRAAGGGLRRVK